MPALRVEARAKINLYLDVIGRRDDGYHEVVSIYQSISLADVLHVREHPSEIRVLCTHPGVPAGDANLSYRAACLLREKTGARGRGATIVIEKRIPVGAGLAGGSADAAATLRALNRLWGLELPAGELAAMGGELGSDVPFCLRGGTAVGRGRGEVLTPLPSPPRLYVALAKPGFSVSTTAAYRELCPRQWNRGSPGPLLEALETGDINGIAGYSYNVFEAQAFSRHPELRLLRDRMLAAGAPAVRLSGTGPTLFAVLPSAAAARRVALGAAGVAAWYAVAATTRGPGTVGEEPQVDRQELRPAGKKTCMYSRGRKGP